ncbi:nitrate- and nitrite sensing domain-containing protein [Nonomuraea africana]|uniref:histidine kinase n=1 Tax=Nonomuraea africana TaxID=46171 RepID=A0ABR9KWD8_9ACTN|nr:nitrate- and nitrite sensing domain-containing protein [Nonomuraea africana]MBE1566356.1 signal transduction histidine kinase [Nonomuraea africana]
MSRRTRADDGGWRLRNWRVRARLVALILVPTAAAVLLGGLQVVASTGAAADYDRANQLAQLAERVGALSHELGAERARTSWYIALGRPERGLDEVRKQMSRTDTEVEKVRQSAVVFGADLTGRTGDEVEAVLARLEDLAALRDQALESDLLPGAALGSYTAVISDLLALNDELGKGTDDEELARQSATLDALARAKESASMQQALLTTVLVAGRFEQEQLKAFLGEQASEANERKAFAEEATSDERRRFDEAVNGRRADRARFLRELVLDRANAGAPLKGLDLSKPDDAREWFEAAAVVVDSLRTVEERHAAGIVSRSGLLAAEESQRAYLVAGAVIALLLAILLITTGVARSLVRPLRRLRSEALEIAGDRLPAFVQRLREARDGGPPAEVAPIGVFSRDEVGEVARAFDEVHREAVRLAGDEAKLRANVNAMFVNLSRRSQTLVERQLSLIERLERGERDDNRLGDLFRLDHLATRMRRNSENLLVLAGQEAARKWTQPVELMDIVRAALGEVESYDRVVNQMQSEVAIAGQAVNDTVHLLAELVENAVSFSSSDTKVAISSNRIDGGGVMIAVTDSGIGMSQEEIAQANWRLANPPVVDVSVSRRMGLFVVGRLALRHDIRVQLRRQDAGGLTAMVLIPEALLTAIPGQLPGPGQPAHGPHGPHGQPAHGPHGQPALGLPGQPGHGPHGQAAHGAPGHGPLATHGRPPAHGQPLAPGHAFAPGQPPGGPVVPAQAGPMAYEHPSLDNLRPTPMGAPVRDSPSGFDGPPAFDGPSTFDSAALFDGPGTYDSPPVDWFATNDAPSTDLSDRTANGLPRRGGQGEGLGFRQMPGLGGSPGPYSGQADATRPLPRVESSSLETGDEEFLPIFAAVESNWFKRPDTTLERPKPTDGGRPHEGRHAQAAPPSGSPQSPQQPDDVWSSPADAGWQAARSASEPNSGGLTSSGLPKRKPRANLVPGSALPQAQSPAPPLPPVSPDRIRSRLASYQQGVRKGRAEIEGAREEEEQR